MRRKLFTPVNFGAFDLRHRLVIDWGRAVADQIEAARQASAAITADALTGGLVIHDPGQLVWFDAALPSSATFAGTEQAWRTVIYAAQTSGQSTLARLAAPTPRHDAHEDFERILADHVHAAWRARSSGFDGIEVDAVPGSLIYRLLLRNHKASSGLTADPLAFFDDLVEALVSGCGRERVGIRFAPYRRGGSLAHAAMFDGIIRTAHERELAYLHLVEAKPAKRWGEGTTRASSTAKTVRGAYPGVLIASGDTDFAHANALVESRWADAYCFSAGGLTGDLLDQIRAARAQGNGT